MTTSRLVRLLFFIILPMVFSFYYLIAGKLLETGITLIITVMLYAFPAYLDKKRVPSKVDYTLATSVFHMYSLSLGETSPEDLVKTMAENKEYGFYSKTFERIRKLAKDFGYGYTKATQIVAYTVKPPLKDILVRCTSVFSSVDPKGYLEIESSTLMEEYSGYYERAIETLKTIGGVFTAFQSTIVFLIMTLAIMTVFMLEPTAILYGYVIACLALIIMYFLFKAASPKVNLVYIGNFPPRMYTLTKWTLIVFIPSSTIWALLAYSLKGAAYAFIVAGVGAMVTGFFGYRLERFVNKVDDNYPTFLKALGESLASTSDLKAAFSYILYMELGPLKKLSQKALARLKLGFSNMITLEALSSEAASYQAHISNKILLDALNRGANPFEIGRILGKRVVKFIELRRKREVVGKNFQTIAMVMQLVTVALLVVLEVLAEFLSASLMNLPYFNFSGIPLNVVTIGNVAVTLIMAVVNALIIKEVSAGFWGSFFLNLGVLFIVSGAAWIAVDTFLHMMLKSLPTLTPVPTP